MPGTPLSETSVALPNRPPQASFPIIAWIAPVLWMVMIAVGSTESFSAPHTIGWLARVLAFMHFNAAQLEFVNHVLRKIGHFSVYGVLSLLLFRACMSTLSARTPRRSLERWSARAFALAIAGCVLVASLDEFHQSFVRFRGASVRDVILDSFGAVFAQMLLIVIFYGKRRKSVE
jgi:VanZ family protein